MMSLATNQAERSISKQKKYIIRKYFNKIERGRKTGGKKQELHVEHDEYF